jgi:hypothetical protein
VPEALPGSLLHLQELLMQCPCPFNIASINRFTYLLQ